LRRRLFCDGEAAMRIHAWHSRRATYSAVGAVLIASALVAGCLPPPPPPVPNGTYTAVQCWPGVGSQDFSGFHSVDLTGLYHFTSDCSPYAGDPRYDSHGLGIVFPFQMPYDAQSHWMITAPYGTNFASVSAANRRFNANGWYSEMYGLDAHGGDITLGGAPADGVWHNTSAPGPFSGLELRMTCEASSCLGAYDPYIFGRQFAFVVHDFTAPKIANFSWSLVGSQTATVSASDDGGGISRTYLEVNGTKTSGVVHTCNVVSGTGIGTSGIVANTLTPCPPSVNDTFAVNTRVAPFKRGDNSVRACVDDYADLAAGSQPNTTCSPTVTIPA
jgi:hypothetical protein